jgi:RNA polymerase sigma-B factor
MSGDVVARPDASLGPSAPGAGPRERAIAGGLPLVRSIARRYVHTGEPLDDLVQVGTIGLIKAVDRFDPAAGHDLAALARPSIEGEIRHHLRDRAPGVRAPRPDRELAARLRATEADLTAQRRRTPTPGEVAAAAGVPEARAAEALRADGARRSLARSAEPPEAAADATEAAEARALLAAGWAALDDRERRMLHLRFHEDRSQAQIGRELGLSQAHVSRLLRAALDRLRAEVGDAPAAPAARSDRGRATGPAPARRGHVLLRLPPSLHDDLARAAADEGVSLNAYAAARLAAATARDAAAAPDPPRRRAVLIANAVAIALAALTGLALLLVALLG